MGFIVGSHRAALESTLRTVVALFSVAGQLAGAGGNRRAAVQDINGLSGRLTAPVWSGQVTPPHRAKALMLGKG